MQESDGSAVSSASAGGAEENDNARLQQLERKLADMAALFDRQHEMLTRLAKGGRGEESGGARGRGATILAFSSKGTRRHSRLTYDQLSPGGSHVHKGSAAHRTCD